MANRYNGKISRPVTAMLYLITGASGWHNWHVSYSSRRLTSASDGGRRRQAFRFRTRIHQDPLGPLLSNHVHRQEFGPKPLSPQALSARPIRVHSRAIKKASSRIGLVTGAGEPTPWWLFFEGRGSRKLFWLRLADAAGLVVVHCRMNLTKIPLVLCFRCNDS